MTAWRFYPLADFPECGILVSGDGKPFSAVYLTPDQARAMRQRERLPIK